MSHQINKTFICQECVFVFTVHTKQKSGYRTNCPNCADNIAVKKYIKPKVANKQFWKEEELKLIDKVIAGELLIYQVAVKLGRTRKSIQRRVDRRKEEMNN